MNAYLIRDDDGTVIGQYLKPQPPETPDNWDGGWNVENVDRDDLNSEPVEWWDE